MGDYKIHVHSIKEEQVQVRRVVFVEVEYRNPGAETLSCRRNQWVLYDADEYTYKATPRTALLERSELPALGGESFIRPDMRVRGWLAFEIPSAAKLERLQFFTAFLGTKTAEFLLEEA